MDQEGDIPIPIPITSAYVGGGGIGHNAHMIHHDHPTPQNHIIPCCSAAQLIPSNGPIPPPAIEDHMPYKKVVVVKYRECLKNHAAAMGGNATDGCGEFMPSGEGGSLEALKCSACNCHRNFHKKEIEGDSSCDYYHHSHLNKMGRKIMVGHHAFGYPPTRGGPTPHQMIMSYNLGSIPSESDEQDGGGVGIMSRPPQMIKKRFRTKFTQEQKEKMLNFADKVGWRMQKQEEAEVLQFCQEIGVKRRVLKVWMHNNKHSLAKKNSSTTTTTT